MLTQSNIYRLLLILVSVSFLSGCESTIFLPKPSSGHEPKIIASDIRHLWSLEEIYTMAEPSPAIAAEGGNVCFIGFRQSDQEDFKIHCFDSHNGDEIWTTYSGPCGHLIIGSNGVFLGCSGMTHIIKFDFQGKNLWSTSLRGPGIGYMQLIGNQLQVLTTIDELFGLDISNGDATLIDSNNRTMLLYTPSISYIKYIGLQAVDNNDDKELWHIEFPDRLELGPIFLPYLILQRTGRVLGSVYGINRATGAILWNTDKNIVSNIAISQRRSEAYVLTRDGQLLAINLNSGQLSTLVEFLSVPFILNGEETVGGYDLAFDDTLNILYVLLGDSRQLFTFQLR